MGAKIPGANATGTNMVPNPTESNKGGVNAPADILSMLGNQSTTSRCDQPTREYIEKLEKCLAAQNRRITSIPISISKIESRALVDEDTKAVVLLSFAATDSGFDGLPASERGAELTQVLRQMRKDVGDVLNHIVVSDADLQCVEKMATAVVNHFKTVQMANVAFTVESLSRYKFVVISNLDRVMQFVNKYSPHAVPARADIGVLVAIEQQKPHVAGMPYNQFEKELTEVFAITGYTRIMSPEQSGAYGIVGPRYVPIPTISDVVTSLPDRRLLTMALPIAAASFIMQSLWSRPYSTFAKNKPNLGSLMVDPKTKHPLFLSSIADLNGFANTYLTQPYLAIDVTDGRYRMIGIDDFIYNRSNILQSINQFLGVAPVADNADPSLMTFKNFTGTVTIDGKNVDSREVDYLLLASRGADIEKISGFLAQPYRPGDQMEQIRTYFPEARSLYSTTTVILDAQFIVRIGQALEQKLQLTYDTLATGNCNITQLLTGQGNNFGNFSGMSRGFAPGMNFNSTLSNPYGR